MSIYRKTINGLPLVMERKNLTDTVVVFMISMQNDPVQFPMVYKKEYGGWFSLTR